MLAHLKNLTSIVRSDEPKGTIIKYPVQPPHLQQRWMSSNPQKSIKGDSPNKFLGGLYKIDRDSYDPPVFFLIKKKSVINI